MWACTQSINTTIGEREKGGVPVGLRKGGRAMWASIQRSQRAQGAWMSMTPLQQAWGRNSKRAARTQPMCCRGGSSTPPGPGGLCLGQHLQPVGGVGLQEAGQTHRLVAHEGGQHQGSTQLGDLRVHTAHANNRNNTHTTGSVPHAGDAATHPNQRLCVTLPLPCAYGHPVLL